MATDSGARVDAEGAGTTGEGSPIGGLAQRPVVRTGIYAWALLGVVGVLIVAGLVIQRVAVVVIPLVLALFPAAVLAPPTRWLKDRGVPPAAATLLVLLLAVGIGAGVVQLLVVAVSGQADQLAAEVQQGAARLEAFLASGPFGLDPIQLEQLIQRARQALAQSGQGLIGGVFGAAAALVETVAALLFGLVALFFYLMEGGRIAAWVRDLFPRRVRGDVEEIGRRAWDTIGGYIRGQALIALIDAILIGTAIALLGVPLVFALAVLVFLGGLLPIVGAFIAGSVAVLVALATEGVITALILLAVILVVQELEGDILAPYIIGKTVRLHPLAAIAALTAGAVLFGILGAFLSIPVTASAARAVGYLRERVPG